MLTSRTTSYFHLSLFLNEYHKHLALYSSFMFINTYFSCYGQCKINRYKEKTKDFQINSKKTEQSCPGKFPTRKKPCQVFSPQGLSGIFYSIFAAFKNESQRSLYARFLQTADVSLVSASHLFLLSPLL